MFRLLRRLMLATGLVAGTAAVMEWRRARLAGQVPFNGLRLAMNDRVNPWLMQRGLAGGTRSEIATIEHIGRRTGEVHLTPVHPTFEADHVWIPLPYGEQSQWAQNVIAAGHSRLQLHDTIYELDEPQIVAAAEDPKLARPVAQVAGWLGIEYLRLHRFAEHAGSFASEETAKPAVEHVLGPAFEQVEEEVPVHA
jgi:hypothetical protein